MTVSESSYFDNVDDYITFLRDTLIPDLVAAGSDATAQDFREAIYWINHYRSEHNAAQDRIDRGDDTTCSYGSDHDCH